MTSTIEIRRDQVQPGCVFRSSHGYEVLVTKVIDDAINRTEDRHVAIYGHLHANRDNDIVVERYPAASKVSISQFNIKGSKPTSLLE